MSRLNLKRIKQYEDIFGINKMLELFEEFLHQSRNIFEQIEKLINDDNVAELHICFHNLRSSSLVFGMDAFSEQCSLIEKNIINHMTMEELEKDIQFSKIIYDEENAEVYAYLNRGGNVRYYQ